VQAGNGAADKTAVITGGNAGLGYACSRTILAADEGWQVVLAGRDPERTASAVARLVEQTGSECVTSLRLDLASLASVRRFADTYAAQDLPPLRALVCNAGVQVVDRVAYTEDGFELTFGVNHLGHFLLANLLLPRLAAPGRIIFVSSDTHDPARHTGMPAPRYRSPKMLAWPERYPDPEAARESMAQAGQRRYTTSKLCNIYCANELARRLEQVGLSAPSHPITGNAFNPGMMPGTGLARGYGLLQRFGWYVALPALRATLRPAFLASVRDSGAALAHLVIDQALAKVTGKYFSGEAMVPSSHESYDEMRAAELWQGSTELVRLAQDETFV